MKRILLTMLGALAVVSNAHSDQLFDEQVVALARQAKQDAVDQAFIDTEHALKRQIDTDTQIAIDRERRELQEAEAEAAKEHKYKRDAVLDGELSSDEIIDQETALPGLWRGLDHQKLRSEIWQRQHPVTGGDRLPLWSQYDDEATIRMYLHDSGYTDLSDAQIAKVHAYMKANGIKHVSEFSQ